MALVEFGRLALVMLVGHKGDLVLEVIGAVVKDRSSQRYYDNLRGTTPHVSFLEACHL